MATFTVAFYEIDRAYGGPEEGGWWFDCGTLERLFKTFKTEAEACKCAARANRLLRVIQRGNRRVDSVIYSGGTYRAQVYDCPPPALYPEQRPFYE